MKLQEELDTIDIPSNIGQLSPMEQLAIFWGVIAIILKFVKIFTGKRADEKIDLILEWGKDNL